MQRKTCLLASLLTLIGGLPLTGISAEPEFVSLFDGKTLTGWKLVGKQGAGYHVRNGSIVCPPGGGGNLLSEKQYKDFILRFEFKLASGSNNGLAIRSPLQATNLAYDGMELQIIDNSATRYRSIHPWQKHGSIYHVFPAKTGFLRAVGTWNTQEVIAEGRHVQVILNGQLILDANLDLVTDPRILTQHPGLMRPSGHVGFLGHGEPVEIRKIRIKVLQTD
jgi:hypothetical protein